VTETAHTRSRRASLYGLILQILAFAGILILSELTRSRALAVLSWYIGTGAVLWFAALLIFRQRELVALEALDLEELRRERQTTGAEGMFDQAGAEGPAFRVAEARLRFLQRYFVPSFGLIEAILLAALGAYGWTRLKPLLSTEWPALANVPIAMIVLGIIGVLFFLFSRYASGMARVPEWQLLRGCASYMLGNALGLLAAIVVLGIYQYAQNATAEHVLAYALCVLMLVLSAETLFAFILDIYRPRMPEVEPRACFDSRLLALIAEPGGIASTIAEAINYQFGFEVSQTWFYQLLQRTFVPLLGVGLAALWLLSTMLVVQPGQYAIIERFGAQINPDAPLQPGFYWKLPWPIEIARMFDVGRIQQVNIGFAVYDAQPESEASQSRAAALWTDERHWGQPHFNFLIPVPPQTDSSGLAATSSGPSGGERAWPVNIVRMDVVVQYRIDRNRLVRYSRAAAEPDRTIRNLAWEEVTRYVACWDIFTLLGEKYATAGAELKQRIARRCDELDLGIEIVYVGVQNVHPEATVAREFRKVISAEQEKIAAIREALVKENEILSKVAGDRETALRLAQAINNIRPNEIALARAERTLSAGSSSQPDSSRIEYYRRQVEALGPLLHELVLARWELAEAEEARRQIELDAELGLGRTASERAAAADKVRQAQQRLRALEPQLQQAWEPLRQAASRELEEDVVSALREWAEARAALDFWNRQLEQWLAGLQGEAAALLAKAQAERWAFEMGAAEEVGRLLGEREAYHAAPRLYRIRKYLQVLVEGLEQTRKFVLAFEPRGRQVRVRFMAEEQARPDVGEIPARIRP
jgi:membrane protease subunit HflK